MDLAWIRGPAHVYQSTVYCSDPDHVVPYLFLNGCHVRSLCLPQLLNLGDNYSDDDGVVARASLAILAPVSRTVPDFADHVAPLVYDCWTYDDVITPMPEHRGSRGLVLDLADRADDHLSALVFVNTRRLGEQTPSPHLDGYRKTDYLDMTLYTPLPRAKSARSVQ